jgi:hypothetical protein
VAPIAPGEAPPVSPLVAIIGDICFTLQVELSEMSGVIVPIAPPFGDRANMRLRFVTVQTMANKRGGRCFDVSLAIAVFGLVFQQLPMLPML